MINVTCFKCGWRFTLDEEAIAESFAEDETPPPRHYVVECPRCRKANKVSLRKGRRRGGAARKRKNQTNTPDQGPSDQGPPDQPTI